MARARALATAALASAVLGIALGPGGARADSDLYERRAPRDPAYEASCGTCHLAFAPAFLPQSSWSALLAGRGAHFGLPLSLSPEVLAELESYLATHGNAPGEQGAPLKVTEQPWFLDEHPARLRDGALADPTIGRMSNCAACHAGAAQGEFDDD